MAYEFVEELRQKYYNECMAKGGIQSYCTTWAKNKAKSFLMHHMQEEIDQCKAEIKKWTDQKNKDLDSLKRATEKTKEYADKAREINEQYKAAISSLKRAEYTKNTRKIQTAREKVERYKEQITKISTQLKAQTKVMNGYKERVQRDNEQVEAWTNKLKDMRKYQMQSASGSGA